MSIIIQVRILRNHRSEAEPALRQMPHASSHQVLPKHAPDATHDGLATNDPGASRRAPRATATQQALSKSAPDRTHCIAIDAVEVHRRRDARPPLRLPTIHDAQKQRMSSLNKPPRNALAKEHQYSRVRGQGAVESSAGTGIIATASRTIGSLRSRCPSSDCPKDASLSSLALFEAIRLPLRSRWESLRPDCTVL